MGIISIAGGMKMAINFNSYLKKNYSDDEIKNIYKRAEEKGSMLISLQNSVSHVISDYAKKK